MNLVGKPKSPDPDDAAVKWARRSLGTLSSREERSLTAWRGNERNEALWQAVDREIGFLDNLAATEEARGMRTAALEARPYRGARHRWVGMGLAASVLMGLAIPLALSGSGPLKAPPADGVLSPIIHVTRAGERRDIRLHDGSIVTLQPDSEVAVRLTARLRDIRLIRGQALFKVAGNRDWPFVVQAGNQRITATGTAFDVQVQRSGAMSVVLVEGHVNVAAMRRSFLGGLVHPAKIRKLAPGQKLLSDDEGNQFVENAQREQRAFAERNRIIFKDITIGEAIAQINRQSADTIEVADPHIAALKISGVYNAARREDFLTALTVYYPLVARPRNGQSTSLEWAEH